MHIRITLAILCAAAGSSACIFVDAEETHPDRDGHGHELAAEHAGDGSSARATIEPKSGSMLAGQATFNEVDGGVEVRIVVEDAPPGMHAVHIHDIGDCSSDDGKSAGGHFNPAGVDHGAPHAAVHHAGDLGNMWVDEDGRGIHVLLMPELSVSAGPYSVVGRSIIVHAAADDLVTQPTGAAGARIGCGEIR